MGNKAQWGSPFFLAVVNTEADDSLYDFEVDGHPGAFVTEVDAIDASRHGVEEFGEQTIVYRCVPVAKIEPLPKSKVTRIKAPHP